PVRGERRAAPSEPEPAERHVSVPCRPRREKKGATQAISNRDARQVASHERGLRRKRRRLAEAEGVPVIADEESQGVERDVIEYGKGDREELDPFAGRAVGDKQRCDRPREAG